MPFPESAADTFYLGTYDSMLKKCLPFDIPSKLVSSSFFGKSSLVQQTGLGHAHELSGHLSTLIVPLALVEKKVGTNVPHIQILERFWGAEPGKSTSSPVINVKCGMSSTTCHIS